MTIFDEQVARKPDLYPWAKEFIEAMQAGHWTDKEFTFTSDVQDFKVKLTDREREIVVKTLSAIAQIEVAVKTFWAKLGENLPHPSLSDLGYVMANIEVIHNNAYERLLSVLDMEDVFNENMKLEWMSGRVKYLKKYTHKFYQDTKKQYVYALILFTLFVENVSLFSQFYIILWFGRFRNALKDTNQQILYTKNEESCHSKIGIKLVNTIRQELPHLFDSDLESRVSEEAIEAFNAESKIIDWIIGDWSGARISAVILKEYIKSRINDSLVDIGFKKIFEIDTELKRDFEWMDEEVFGNSSTDFFNQRPVEYNKNVTIDINDLL
jgi:ribonucleoside-diphosphate reductase beta chain